MVNRMRIVTMLMAVIGIFALMQLVSGGLFFSSLSDNQQSFAVSHQLRQQQAELNQAWNMMLQTRINLSRSSARIVSDNGQLGNASSDLLNNAKATLTKAQQEFTQFKAVQVSLPEINSTLTEVDSAFQDYNQALSELVQYLQAGNMQAYFAQPTQGKQNALEQAVNRYDEMNVRLAQQAYMQSKSDYRFAQWQLAFLAVALTGVIALVWYGIRHILLGPLNRVIAHIREIASGNLTEAIPVTGHNELTELASSVKHMQQALIQTVSSVRQGTDAIYTGTSEIAAGNNDLSSRTEEQAAALEQTAASMEELTATVKQNAENARQASQLARSASDTAQRGGNVVNGVVNTMHDIAASSKKIADIISVIDGIAFQTNILALNAAVEAARAGEQGRGFAVVAGEVRNLASRSAQAAKEIKLLIEDSVSRVDTGSALVETAGETMQEIVSSVTRVTDIMGEISSASDEQSRGIDQVALAVSEMDRVTQQNASLVQQSAAAAAALEEQASRLSMAVAAFRLQASQLRQQASASPTTAVAPASSPRPVSKAVAVAEEGNWETF